ncbi:MAG: AMP-binding protein [Firmicutes bacterium]|nr:AMP-binding protein [Bacillota bacterium]
MNKNIARDRVMHALLERKAAEYGGRTYICYEDKEFSFEDVNKAANRVASGLQKLGVSKGDKVAVVMDNCPEEIFLVFGLSKLGAVSVLINVYHKGDILKYMLDHADCSVLVMHSQYIDRLRVVLPETPKVQSVIVLEKDKAKEDSKVFDGVEAASAVMDEIRVLGKQAVAWFELVNNDGCYQPVDVLWFDPLMILYTSGTTGLSKGVLLPQNLLFTMTERFYNWVLEQNLSKEDCIYVPSPLFHAHAWHAGVNLALLSGARMALVKRFSASKYWIDARKYGCTVTTGPGAAVKLLLSAEPKPDDADNPLRYFLGGQTAERITEAFERRFGLKQYEFYGSTELGSPTMNSISNRKIGACGKRHPDFEIKIVDDNGVEVKVNETGEILARPLVPYTVLTEYYKLPEKTVEAWRDLWFHTGDCGFFDEDGYLHFADRKKDSLRRRGENVSSFEVERIINSHPSVLESAVIGVEGEEIMMCVVLKLGQSISPEELIDFCGERMAYFMVPRYVRFMDALPKNDATQRVEKFKLREEGITPDTWDREKSGYKLKR